MQKTYSVHELENILHPVFANHGVRRAVLFGSYAKGQATPRSDIDILVDSGLRGLAFFGLLESVTSSLSVPVDLIDVSQIEKSSRIEMEIQQTGVPLYTQSKAIPQKIVCEMRSRFLRQIVRIECRQSDHVWSFDSDKRNSGKLTEKNLGKH